MYIHNCPECGKQYSTQEKVNRVKCPYCGAETNVSYADQEPQQSQWQQFGQQTARTVDDVFSNGPSGRSRGIAGLLAILVGAIGVHYFYIGKTNAGVIFLLATLITCGALGVVTQIISIIQGILFFTSSQEEFEARWVNSPSTMPLF